MLAFPKGRFEIVNKDQADLEFPKKSTERIDISYLIMAEVISMAQFRPPKFDNENEFRQKIIHTTLFVQILVRPWPFGRTRSDTAANQVRAASKISAGVGGSTTKKVEFPHS